MSISEGSKIGVVGQEGFILIAISSDGSEEVLLALTGEGAEESIQSAVREALAVCRGMPLPLPLLLHMRYLATCGVTGGVRQPALAHLDG